MTPVYMVLTKGRQWYAPLLRWVLDFEYNHTLVVYRDSLWGGWWGVQIDALGVHPLPMSLLKRTFSKCKAYESVVPLDAAFAKSRKFVGDKYDWRALFGNILRLLWWRLSGKKWMKPLQDNTRQMCTEFMVYFLQNARVSGTELFNPSLLSPEMLDDFFKKSDRFCETSPAVFLQG